MGEILSVSTCGISPLFLYDFEKKDWRTIEIHETHEQKYRNEGHISFILNIVDFQHLAKLVNIERTTPLF